MQRLLKIFLLVMPLLALTNCENANNYSQLLKKEEALINDWIERNGIVLLDEFPADTVFAENEMYHFTDGIYFQLLEKGEGDTLRQGDELVLRYRQSLLTENAVWVDYWTTQDRPFPNQITYGSLTNSCKGWQAAFEIMLRNDSRARIIVPSKLGMDDSSVVPYLYELKIKVVPK